jgi:bifunctional non-homologous end joining protein LigD
MKLEGVVSKRIDAPYRPGDRGLWVKSKCLNREEFVVVGWTDPEGGRGYIGALLLAKTRVRVP